MHSNSLIPVGTVVCICALFMARIPHIGAVGLPQDTISEIEDQQAELIDDAVDDIDQTTADTIADELAGDLGDELLGDKGDVVDDIIDDIGDIVNANDIAEDLAEYINGLPSVSFPCKDMPEVCTNMCFAVNCDTFPTILTYDSPSNKTKETRRKEAGCGKGNKCNKRNQGRKFYRGPMFPSCDEYPFASTQESGLADGMQLSRCVPMDENNKQGGLLSACYAKFRKQGLSKAQFKVDFVNPGASGVKYCTKQTSCKNDGFEIKNKRLASGSGLSKRGEKEEKKNKPKRQLFHFYRTKSGAELASTGKYEIGEKFERVLEEEEKVPDGFVTTSSYGNFFIEDEIEAVLDADTMLPIEHPTMHKYSKASGNSTEDGYSMASGSATMDGYAMEDGYETMDGYSMTSENSTMDGYLTASETSTTDGYLTASETSIMDGYSTASETSTMDGYPMASENATMDAYPMENVNSTMNVNSSTAHGNLTADDCK